MVGTLAPWEEPKEAGDQIWCINRAYLHQPNLDRLYMMDPLSVYKEEWGEGFIDEVNALDVPVVMQMVHSEIKRSEAFNHRESFENFSIVYFGATVANAIANAIEASFAAIVLHQMYIKGKSEEYLYARGPVGFWIGQAIGAGMGVEVSPNCYMEQQYLHYLGRRMEARRSLQGTALEKPPLPPPPLREMWRDEVGRWAARKKAGTGEYSYPEV
jgi:hypothetical protein